MEAPDAPAEDRAPPPGVGPLAGRIGAIVAGVGFGTLGIFSRLIYDQGGERFTMVVLRFLGASIVLVAVALLRRRPLPSGPDAAVSVLLGLSVLAATFCLFAGYENASPGLVTLLFYVYPLIVTVAARAIFREELTRWRIALLGTGMAGIALTVGIPSSATAAGIGWGLGAGVWTAVYILGGRHVMSRTVDSFQFVALSYLGAAIMLVPLAAIVGVSGPPAGAVGYALCLIVVSTVLPVLLFYFAVRRIGAGAAARLATIEALTAVVLSYLVLGDPLTATQIAGGVIVLTSVVLLATPAAAVRRLYRRAPEPATR